MDSSSSLTRQPGRREVIHVINGEHYSGAERVQDLLAQRLPEFGFNVTFVCTKPGQFASLRQCQSAPLFDLPMRLRVDMRPARALARLARQRGCSLLHAHTPRSLMVARLAAMITPVPLIYHVHSPTSRDSSRPLRNWLNNATERFSLTGVDRLITVSSSLARHMVAEGIDAQRIVTVPNGVPGRGSLARRSAPSSTWTMGTIALFRPRKGLEVLLESLAQLRHQGHDVRLRAVGGFETPEYARTIHGLVDQLGIAPYVVWTGFTQDVPAELDMMDLLVLPSLFGEGLPMVVLEAMAAGVPVVSTRVEGVPEAVRDGVDGLLVEPGNATELSRAIGQVTVAPDRWSAMRGSAYQRHEELFSDRRMAAQVAAVYRDVLAQAGAMVAFAP